MNNLEIIDELEDSVEIEDQDYELRYPHNLFDKISTHIYRNQSNNMLHIADVPITSETKHRYPWYQIEANLKAQGIDTSKYNKNKYDLVYVGNPIEEVEKVLPSLSGMKTIKHHSKIDVKVAPKKDLYMGHLTNVKIKTVRNRPTAVADQLIVDDEHAINDIINNQKRGLSVHWIGKFKPIEQSPYKDKEFYSDRYKDKVVEFVKMDLQPNNLSHVLKQNDELCTIKDEDIINIEGNTMKTLEQSLLSKIGSAIKDVFSTTGNTEITDEDKKEKDKREDKDREKDIDEGKEKKLSKDLKKDEEEEEDDIEKDKDRPDAEKRAKKSLKEDEDREKDLKGTEKLKKDIKKDIEDEDIINLVYSLRDQVSAQAEENRKLKQALLNVQEIADQDAEVTALQKFVNTINLGSRGIAIVKDNTLGIDEKYNQLAKSFDCEIADEDLGGMDNASKRLLIKQLNKQHQMQVAHSYNKTPTHRSATLDSQSDELLNKLGM